MGHLAPSVPAVERGHPLEVIFSNPSKPIAARTVRDARWRPPVRPRHRFPAPAIRANPPMDLLDQRLVVFDQADQQGSGVSSRLVHGSPPPS